MVSTKSGPPPKDNTGQNTDEIHTLNTRIEIKISDPPGIEHGSSG